MAVPPLGAASHGRLTQFSLCAGLLTPHPVTEGLLVLQHVVAAATGQKHGDLRSRGVARSGDRPQRWVRSERPGFTETPQTGMSAPPDTGSTAEGKGCRANWATPNTGNQRIQRNRRSNRGQSYYGRDVRGQPWPAIRRACRYGASSLDIRKSVALEYWSDFETPGISRWHSAPQASAFFLSLTP